MDKPINILFAILTLFATFSCVSDIDLEISGAETRIFFFSEFEPGEGVSFYVSTAKGLNDEYVVDDPVNMNQLDVKITENNNFIDPAFRYNPTTKRFEAPYASWAPLEKAFYSFNLSLIDYPEIPSISSETFIPIPQSFESLDLLEFKEEQGEFGSGVEMKVRMTVPTSHPYYEVEAYYFHDGVKKNVPLKPVSDIRGVIAIDHRNSLIIDSKKNGMQFIDVVINTELPYDIIVDGKIEFKLKSVNADHYNFHENYAKRKEAITAPISEPVVYYTNVEKGLGLLSGYSSTTYELEF